jgi:hypothetical protein
MSAMPNCNAKPTTILSWIVLGGVLAVPCTRKPL